MTDQIHLPCPRRQTLTRAATGEQAQWQRRRTLQERWTSRFEWLELARNLSAGTTDATAGSSLLSATYSATSERSQGQRRSRTVRGVEPSSRERQHATGTWRMRNAKPGATPITEKATWSASEDCISGCRIIQYAWSWKVYWRLEQDICVLASRLRCYSSENCHSPSYGLVSGRKNNFIGVLEDRTIWLFRSPSTRAVEWGPLLVATRRNVDKSISNSDLSNVTLLVPYQASALSYWYVYIGCHC